MCVCVCVCVCVCPAADRRVLWQIILKKHNFALSRCHLRFLLPQQDQKHPQRPLTSSKQAIWPAALWKLLQLNQITYYQTHKHFFLPWDTCALSSDCNLYWQHSLWNSSPPSNYWCALSTDFFVHYHRAVTSSLTGQQVCDLTIYLYIYTYSLIVLAFISF